VYLQGIGRSLTRPTQAIFQQSEGKYTWKEVCAAYKATKEAGDFDLGEIGFYDFFPPSLLENAVLSEEEADEEPEMDELDLVLLRIEEEQTAEDEGDDEGDDVEGNEDKDIAEEDEQAEAEEEED